MVLQVCLKVRLADQKVLACLQLHVHVQDRTANLMVAGLNPSSSESREAGGAYKRDQYSNRTTSTPAHMHVLLPLY